jgi:subtilisin family serine protease
MADATVPPALYDPEQRQRFGLPANDEERGWYMVELNLLHGGGVQQASQKFEQLYAAVIPDAETRPVIRVSKTYYRCSFTTTEWRKLISEDEKANGAGQRVIYKLWPDFPVKPLIDRSVATVKADAAFRSYAATGEGICWAVIDSGIDVGHAHFGGALNPDMKTLTDPAVVELHRDFTGPCHPDATTSRAALTDRYGHGTHVAGIIAGGLPEARLPDCHVFENVFTVTDPDNPAAAKDTTVKPRPLAASAQLRGVAPQCRLVSLKVLDDEGNGRASDVIRAMEYIREEVNGDPKVLRIHGVNLSIGYEFDAELFACGQSPLCLEVDRLVKSGVVVVVAAGNTGYGKVSASQRNTQTGLSNTINDPGNSVLAITVGATHRDAPHTYGVSYFSSKGPTGDGRAKPDLVAPGERITSCATGKYLESGGGEIPDGIVAYIDDTGTSMAAPHVSGAIAAFLSIRREYILQPEEVKRLFMESATPLGRERYFEGRGLVDLMRAIQSV